MCLSGFWICCSCYKPMLQVCVVNVSPISDVCYKSASYYNISRRRKRTHAETLPMGATVPFARQAKGVWSPPACASIGMGCTSACVHAPPACGARACRRSSCMRGKRGRCRSISLWVERINFARMGTIHAEKKLLPLLQLHAVEIWHCWHIWDWRSMARGWVLDCSVLGAGTQEVRRSSQRMGPLGRQRSGAGVGIHSTCCYLKYRVVGHRLNYIGIASVQPY
jgi:hypothetical protein